MNDDKDTPDISDLPHGPKGSSVARGALNVGGGLIPFAGGLPQQRRAERFNLRRDAVERATL